MKKQILSILFLFLTQLSFSQEVGFVWNTPEKLDKKSSTPEILGTNEDDVYILKSKNADELNSYYIVGYKKDNLEEIIRIDFGKKLPKEVLENNLYDVYMLKQKFVIISFTKKKELMGSVISLDGKVEKGRILIDRADSKDKEFEGFQVAISPDQSVILGYRKTKSQDKKTTAFTFSTYDIDLKRKNSAKVQLPYEEENISFERLRIDEKANVYIVANAVVEGKRKKFNVIQSLLLHLPMADAKPELNEVKLPFEKRIGTSMSFELLENRIVISGMYGNSESEYLEGIFYIEVSRENLEVINATYDKFKSGLQTRERTSNNKLKNGVGFGYGLRNIVLNGQQKTLIFENRLIVYSSDSRGNQYKKTLALDIIVVSLNSDNKIEWNTMIYKNQAISVLYSQVVSMGVISFSVNRYRIYKKFEAMVGFAPLYKDGKFYFVFNDHIDNMKKKSADNIYSSNKKCYSALVVLDANTGKWEKKALFKSKEMKRVLTPDNSLQIAKDKVFVFSYDGSKTNSGILSIE